MKLFHATSVSNLESIQAEGLDPGRSKGKMRVVWLHTMSRREWAILHTQQRHNCSLDEIVLIEVDVPRSKLCRRWRGLWTCDQNISQFSRVTMAAELAQSEVSDDSF